MCEPVSVKADAMTIPSKPFAVDLKLSSVCCMQIKLVVVAQVCPDTSEVVALIHVLIRARPPRDKKHVHGTR